MNRPRKSIVIAAALVLGLGCWAWFIRDVPLTEAARSLLAEPHALPAAENGEYMLWGLSAPPGQPAMDAGIAYASWLSEQILQGRIDEAMSQDDPWNGKSLALELGSLHMPECSWRDSKDCLPQLNWTVSDANGLLERNEQLLSRYQELKRFQYFQRVLPARLDNPIPPYTLAIRASALLQFAAATTLLHSTADEERQDALAVIHEEMGYWRSRLLGNHSLISKLAVLAAVRNGTKLVNELADVLDSKNELEGLLAAVPLMTELERDMTSALSDEAMLQMNAALSGLLGQDGSVKARALNASMGFAGLYRTNHTVNLLADGVAQAKSDFSLPASQLLARKQQSSDQKPDEHSSVGHVWPYYNAIGRAQVELGQSPLLDFAFRIHDCDALIRLVNLKILYRLRSERSQSVVEFVAQSDASMHNPYTLDAMTWNAGRAELGLTGYADPAIYGFGEHWLAVSVDAAR